MFLKVENLTVDYGHINALRDVSLEIGEGEIVTLIGANGAGKTTLMSTIVGLKKATSGEILFEGTPITNIDTLKIISAGITLAPEGRQIFPEMSTRDNLWLGAFLKKDDEKRKELEKVYQLFPRLQERQKQVAGTLSGGEQQMLAVARALMSTPRLLLLDEPSLGLAPLLVKEVFELIHRIRDTGTTVLLVEQNARMALKYSDRGYVLETGKIVLSGRSSDLLEADLVREAYLGGS